MPALPIKIWTGRPVLHIAVPCDAPKKLTQKNNAKNYAKKKEKKVLPGQFEDPEVSV